MTPLTKQLKWFAPAIVLVPVAFSFAARAEPQTAALRSSPANHPVVGEQADGTVLVTTNQTIDPAGHQIEFQGRPVAVALHPNRKTAAVLNGSYQALIVLDLETLTVKQEFSDAGSSASFAGLVYSPDGNRLLASQADGQIIRANVAADGTLSLSGMITSLPKSSIAHPGREDGNPLPGGLAFSDAGDHLIVALSRNNSIAVIDPIDDRLVREIPVGNAPHSVVVVGDKAYVSNQGGRVASAADFTMDSSGTRIVADRTSGFSTTGTVSVVDLRAGTVVDTIAVELHPTAMIAHGTRLYVANTNSDSVSIIDVASNRVLRTIATSPFPWAPIGSSPNSLAMTDDGRLVVGLGRNNALALFDVSGPAYRPASFAGWIPTGWYPTSVVFDDRTGRLVVANGKGLGSLGPEATVGPDDPTNKTGKWVHSNLGTVSVVDVRNESDLGRFTSAVFKNNRWDKLLKEEIQCGVKDLRSGRVEPQPLPACTGEPSVFKHVFYIIKENRTYDQVLGDLPQGNGDPTLVQFGRDVTPNHHALAEEFVLLDNLYDSGSLSADGHQWATQAFVVDYLEKSFGGFTRSYPFNGGDSLAYPQTRFIWDHAARAGKSVRVYGEYANGLRANGVEMGPWEGGIGGGKTTPGVWLDFYRDSQLLSAGRDSELHVKLEAHTEIPSLSAVLSPNFPPYHQIIPDQYRVEIFLREFKQYVKNGNLPELVIMALTSDHTEGTTENYPTPRAMVADNDLALGRVVEAISQSPYWKDSVIFVVEDDAQNGVDHVDGHRMPGFVVSPYTRRGSVDSHYYTQIDVMRAMEQILGLGPMNQIDMAVEQDSMRHVFTTKADFTTYRARPNLIPLDELNPAVSALKGVERDWAIASSRMNFSQPDAADEDLLNRAIWYSTTGFKRPYPGDKRVLSPRQVKLLRDVAQVSRPKSKRTPRTRS